MLCVFSFFLFFCLLFLLLLDYHEFHSENGSLWFLLPEPRHADMEGFLRSSFLLRLVSFPLLPFRIDHRSGRGGRGLTGYAFWHISFRLCAVCACTCLCVCARVCIFNQCQTCFPTYLPKLCVMIVIIVCAADCHAHPDSLQKAHINKCSPSSPFHTLKHRHIRRRSVSFLCMLWSDPSNQGYWSEQ